MAVRHPLSLQLYSARNFPPLEAQVATIARSGFSNVETFGPLHEDTARTRRLLDQHSLTPGARISASTWSRTTPDARSKSPARSA
jgi:hypothetical protein